MGTYDYGSPYDREDRRSALTQGLLAAGLAALGARKGSEYNAFAQAGLLGLGGYNTSLRDATNAREAQAMQRMREQQWAQQQQAWQQQQAEREGMRQAHQAAIIPAVPGGEAEPREGGMTPGLPGGFNDAAYINALRTNPNIDPSKALAYQQMTVKESPFDKPKPEHWTPASLAEYARTRNPASLVPIAKPAEPMVGKINPSDFTPQSVAAFMANGGNDYQLLVPVDKRPQTTVNVTNQQETEFSKALGKALAEQYANLHAGASKAQSRLSALAAIDSAMGDIETSAATPAWNKFASAAKVVGVTVDPNLPRKEAAQAVMNQLALESRSTAEGGGMPGAMSEKDREFLINMNPNMAQTTQGRKLLIETQRRLAKRSQQIAELARDYRRRNGSFDEGFQVALAQWSEANPLFQDLYGVTQQSSPRQSGGAIVTPTPGVYRFDKNGNPL